MAVALWLALQAAATPPSATLIPIEFDLLKVQPSIDGRGCGSGSKFEIIVCGRRKLRDEYPLDEMERRYRQGPIRAEMSLSYGATGRAYVDQVEMPQGQVSKRIMVGIKLPF